MCIRDSENFIFFVNRQLLINLAVRLKRTNRSLVSTSPKRRISLNSQSNRVSLILFTKLIYAEMTQVQTCPKRLWCFSESVLLWCHNTVLIKSFNRDIFEQVWTRFDGSLSHESSSLKEICFAHGKPFFASSFNIYLTIKAIRFVEDSCLRETRRKQKNRKIQNEMTKNMQEAKFISWFSCDYPLCGRQNHSNSVTDGNDLSLVPIPFRISFVRILLSQQVSYRIEVEKKYTTTKE